MSHLGLSNDPWSFRFFPFEIAYFCLGILSYKIYARIKRSDKHAITSIALYFVMLALTFGFPYVMGILSQKAFVLYALMLAGAIPFIFLHFKSNRWDRYIGDLSYPIIFATL